ncbi:MAG: diadenylate cyclase, partial [Candidatus Binatia bacterium]
MSILEFLRWQDLLDIALIAYLIYMGLLLVRGTRAANMLIGMAVIFVVYLASRRLQLYTVSWIFDRFLASFIIVAVVIFQHDIRRLLTSFGRRPLRLSRGLLQRSQMIEELVRGVVTLAGNGVGALIVVQRNVGLNDFVEGGSRLDAVASRELLVSVFSADSPIHDGAIIVVRNRFEAAGCLLPLTTNPNISRRLGTRHRAAIGLTE